MNKWSAWRNAQAKGICDAGDNNFFPPIHLCISAVKYSTTKLYLWSLYFWIQFSSNFLFLMYQNQFFPMLAIHYFLTEEIF